MNSFHKEDNTGPYKKHYKEIEPTTITPAPKEEKEVYTTNYHLNKVDKIIEDLWSLTKNINEYQKGKSIGKFNKKGLTTTDFFDTMYNGIKETLTTEIQNKKETTETLIPYFNILNNVLKLIAKEGERQRIDVANLIVMYQGFVNGYIEQVAEEIQKRNNNEYKN